MLCICAVWLLLIRWGTVCREGGRERERESMLCICAVWLLLIRWGTVCREGGRERERWA